MSRKYWTIEEELYLMENVDKMTTQQLGDQLGRGYNSVADKIYKIGLVRKGAGNTWSEDDDNYLVDKWGDRNIERIAKHLGRSVTAVKVRAQRTGLTRHLHYGEHITLNQLAVLFKISYSAIRYVWIPREIPFTYKRPIKKQYKVILLKDFWEWAKEHKDIIDFSRLEVNILGKEPGWVLEKRKADSINNSDYTRLPWTAFDDERLKRMLNLYKYGYAEISLELGRTELAVKRRIYDLKLKERPLRADNHTLWTNDETRMLIDMISKGYKFEAISKAIKTKTSQACRGKIERLKGGYPEWKEVELEAEQG